MENESSNFLRTIIKDDLASGKHSKVVTRFPPEPNGFLHIGHCKAICANYGLAEEFGGTYHLRFDDTNPAKEDVAYVDAIKRDIKWLGFDWGDNLFFASDYFGQLYTWAQKLVREGKAYVCELSVEEIREYRGTVTEAGKPSPYRDRPADESLALLEKMKNGEVDEGSMVLRAKIDMASNNMQMRDPLMYRVRHDVHHRTGSDWHIYPMYDYAHGLSDAIEGITHSMCSLEFENNRELYDWFVEQVNPPATPRQYEFARLNLSYTVMSKRYLLKLVETGLVKGWDDPRMPTVAGMRRRGVTAEGLRAFCDRVGLAKTNSIVGPEMLDAALRDDLNHKAPRVMAVLEPLEVVVTSWEEGKVDELDADYWPHDVPKDGSRKIAFTKRLFIERSDFAEAPRKGFKRLAPGREVRLRYGYYITCTGVEKDAGGNVIRVLCTHDPESRGGGTADGRKVSGTIHWVSADKGLEREVWLVDRLFKTEIPGSTGNYDDDLNPDSLKVITAVVEPSLASAKAGDRYQFERNGYFHVDPESDGSRFLLTVRLKDTWGKKKKAAAPTAKKPKVGPAKVVELTPAAAALVERGVGTNEAAFVASEPALATLLEVASEHAPPSLVASFLLQTLRGKVEDWSSVDGNHVGSVLALVEAGRLPAKKAGAVYESVAAGDGDAESVMGAMGLEVIADPAVLQGHIDAALQANPGQVAAYRSGKTNMLGFFVGQVMKATGGRADGKALQGLLRASLSSGD